MPKWQMHQFIPGQRTAMLNNPQRPSGITLASPPASVASDPTRAPLPPRRIPRLAASSPRACLSCRFAPRPHGTACPHDCRRGRSSFGRIRGHGLGARAGVRAGRRAGARAGAPRRSQALRDACGNDRDLPRLRVHRGTLFHARNVFLIYFPQSDSWPQTAVPARSGRPGP